MRSTRRSDYAWYPRPGCASASSPSTTLHAAAAPCCCEPWWTPAARAGWSGGSSPSSAEPDSPRPRLQVTYRSAGRLVARVDALFGDDLVIEVAGHGTHSTRSQRQRDEQRRTELTLAGRRVITFTYDDVMDRPDWVVAQLRLALGVVTGSLAR